MAVEIKTPVTMQPTPRHTSNFLSSLTIAFRSWLSLMLQWMLQPLKTQVVISKAIDAPPATSADPDYWFRTSGQDLSNMLDEGNYPEEVKTQFLDYYRDTFCPQLGAKPDGKSLKTVVGWDGNPFEYSFELKGSTKSPGVRFVIDFSPLRPADKKNPLSMATTQAILDSMAERTPMFDDRWHRSLARCFVYDHLPAVEQQALIKKAGYQTSLIMGFDVSPRILIPGKLPLLAKSYFAPNLTAIHEGVTPWKALSSAVRQLPDIESYPNIEHSLSVMEEYLADNPEFENGTRGLSTDLVAPGLARLKIYMRYHGDSFDEIWDYYTLGGRIPGLEEDKEKFRDLFNFTSGTGYIYNETDGCSHKTQAKSEVLRHKPTAIYFSLSPKTPYPVPKVYFSPCRTAPDDQVIARGLDAWLRKYEWYDGGKTMEERVSTVFTHRKLEEKVGIFTFIGLGRKEDPSKKGLSLQVYTTPELYETPRF